MSPARLVLLLLSVCLLTAVFVWSYLRPAPVETPGPATVLTQVREIARLETLEIRLYKKIHFAPEPTESGSLWNDVAQWTRYSLSRPTGRAILFADAQVGLDLDRLGPDNLRVRDGIVELVLPPLEVQVLMRPDETEILDSNLNSEETAKLFALAHEAFEREVRENPELRKKARASAERALQGLILGLGFRDVRFVEKLEGVNRN